MRILVATNLLQAAGLLLLVILLLGQRDDTPVPPAKTGTPAFSFAAEPNITPSAMNEAQLRQIIREELASAMRNEGESRMNDVAARQRTPEENRYQREYVSQQIDYYASVGEISEQDMQELQRSIAELDNAGRKEMLSKLTRAMNTQQIKGQL